MKKIKEGKLEVTLFEEGLIEIESDDFKEVSVEVNIPKPSDPLTPAGALYHITLYRSEENSKGKPFEYDCAWVMKDGTILKRGKEYSEYMRKTRP